MAQTIKDLDLSDIGPWVAICPQCGWSRSRSSERRLREDVRTHFARERHSRFRVYQRGEVELS